MNDTSRPREISGLPFITCKPPTSHIMSEPQTTTNEMSDENMLDILPARTLTLNHSLFCFSRRFEARFSPENAFTTRMHGMESVSTEETAVHFLQIRL